MLIIFILTVVIFVFYGARCFYKLFFKYINQKKIILYPVSVVSFVAVTLLSLWTNDILFGFVIQLFLFFAVSDLLGLINKTGVIKEALAKRTFLKRYGQSVGVVLLTLVMTVAGHFNAVNIDIKHYQLEYEAKSFDPVRIMFVSDVHINEEKREDITRQIVDIAAMQNPDVIVFGGDLVDQSTAKEDFLYIADAIGKLAGSAEVLYVYGNHDIGLKEMSKEYIRHNLEARGAVVLEDELYKRDGITFIGRQESATARMGVMRESIDELVTDDGTYKIVLDHQPKELKKLSRAGVDLSISGHTHNGQIFPFGTLCALLGINELQYGFGKVGDMTAIVGSGASTWAMRVRTQGDSEILIIDIK